jgi:hypothetical protein
VRKQYTFWNHGIFGARQESAFKQRLLLEVPRAYQLFKEMAVALQESTSSDAQDRAPHEELVRAKR